MLLYNYDKLVVYFGNDYLTHHIQLRMYNLIMEQEKVTVPFVDQTFRSQDGSLRQQFIFVL